MTTRLAKTPAGYPAECEERLVLLDGRSVDLRPVVPSDLEELQAAIARADAETIRRRFALAAFAPDGRGVGIARYEGETTWPVVDVAVAVDRDWRGVGLGRELVRRVVRRAGQQGASGLSADFYADNERVRSLLAEAGLHEQRSIDHGVVQDRIDLPAGFVFPPAEPARTPTG